MLNLNSFHTNNYLVYLNKKKCENTRDLNQRGTGEEILCGRIYGLLTKSDPRVVAGEMLMVILFLLALILK